MTTLEAAGLLGNSVKVTLEEFTVTPHPSLAKSGNVTFDVDNVGSITHEMVIVRAPSAVALPKVTKVGERAIGAVNGEAIGAAQKIGEQEMCPPNTRHENLHSDTGHLCAVLQHRQHDPLAIPRNLARSDVARRRARVYVSCAPRPAGCVAMTASTVRPAISADDIPSRSPST